MFGHRASFTALVVLLSMPIHAQADEICGPMPHTAALTTGHEPQLEVRRDGSVAVLRDGPIQTIRVHGEAAVVIRIELQQDTGDPRVVGCFDAANDALIDLPTTDKEGAPLRPTDVLRVRMYGSVRGSEHVDTQRAQAFEVRLEEQIAHSDAHLDAFATVCGPIAAVVQGGGQPCVARAPLAHVFSCQGQAGDFTYAEAGVGALPGFGPAATTEEHTRCGPGVAHDDARCDEAMRLVEIARHPAADQLLELNEELQDRVKELRGLLEASAFLASPVRVALAEWQLPAPSAPQPLVVGYDVGEVRRALATPTHPITALITDVPVGVDLSFSDRSDGPDTSSTARAIAGFLRAIVAGLAAGSPDSVFLVVPRDGDSPTIATRTSIVHRFGESGPGVRHLRVCEDAHCSADGENVRTHVTLPVPPASSGFALLIDASAAAGPPVAYGTGHQEPGTLPYGMSEPNCPDAAHPCVYLRPGTADIVTVSALMGYWFRQRGHRALAFALGGTLNPDVGAGVLLQVDYRCGFEIVDSLFFTLGFGLRLVRAVTVPGADLVSEGFGTRFAGVIHDDVPTGVGLPTHEQLVGVVTVGLAVDLITLGEAAASVVEAIGGH